MTDPTDDSSHSLDNNEADTSVTQLLDLPNEMLRNIVDHLDNGDMANFARVNSRCRQVSHSIQFAHVKLDYSPRAMGLLAKLVEEGDKDIQSNTQLNIGNFIIELTVAKGSEWWARKHKRFREAAAPGVWDAMLRRESNGYLNPYNTSITRDRDEDIEFNRMYDVQMRAELFQEAKNSYETYLADVVRAIKGSLPNMITLKWLEGHGINHNALDTILRCGLRHLHILDQTVFEDSCFDISISPESMSTIETLSLSCNPNTDYTRPFFLHSGPLRNYYLGLNQQPLVPGTRHLLRQEAFRKLVHSILEACGPNLQGLYLDAAVERGSAPELESLGPMGDFPCLTKISFGDVKVAKDTLSHLLRSPISHLNLSAYGDGTKSHDLKDLNILRNLEHIDICSIQSPSALQDIIAFLNKHALKIRDLDMLADYSEADATGSILPTLVSGRFASLTCLSLRWANKPTDIVHDSAPHGVTLRGVVVPVESLAAIGRITTLEQLYLGAGTGHPATPKWLIDHQSLQNHLRPLNNLRRLVIEFDTYFPSPYWNGRELRSIIYGDSFGSYYIQKNTTFRALARDSMGGRLEDQVRLRSRPELDKEIIGSEPYELWAPDLSELYGDDKEWMWEEISDIYGKKFKANETSRVWFEILHRNRMLEHAEAYASVLPSLERIYCGEWPMKIKVPGQGTRGNAVPMAKKRRFYPFKVAHNPDASDAIGICGHRNDASFWG